MAELNARGIVRDTRVLRLITIVLLVVMCVFKLFITYRGLDQPAAMDQAQIARSVAKGDGFVTKFFRPIEVMTHSRQATAEEPLSYQEMRDTTHAPLNIVAMAVGLKIFGYDNFESCRMTGGGYIYAPDRVISSVSMLFFIISVCLTYALVSRLFDEVVACSTSVFLILSDLMLRYSVSGLPQPLMLCFMLAALHTLLSAVRAHARGEHYWTLLYVILTFVSMGLMCLSGWMGLWVAGGLLLFCCFHFRPAGSYAFAAALILLVLLIVPAVRNYQVTGSVMGNAMLGLYNAFGGGESAALRAADLSSQPFNGADVVLRFLGATFSQLRGLYVNMGSILVTPFFFLAIFNRYKRSDVQAMKWAVFSMWAISCVGMALFGVNVPMNPSQLAVLFAPLFVAYGISLVFNMLARGQVLGSNFNQARGLTLFLMILVSAGPFLATVPRDLHFGIWLGERGRPMYPPYYPPSLNLQLADITSPRHVIVTDQPWAVAWYADRKAMWIPRSVPDLVELLEPTLEKGGVKVQGFLITPSSHSPVSLDGTAVTGGVGGVIADMGDFAPLALEGKLLQITPQHNLALADLFVDNPGGNRRTETMGQVVSSRGRFSRRVPLLGAEIMYYGTSEPIE